MAPTMKDVARQAGVSIKTVSRVLNNSSEVTPTTRLRVQQKMKDLRYRPNANARGLIRQKTETIALCIAYETQYVFQNPYFSDVLRGITEVCNDMDYNLLLQTKEEDSFLDLVYSGRVDGLLYMCVQQDTQFTEELLDSGFPLVLIGHGGEDSRLPWIEVDDYFGAYTATKHLLDIGHRDIGFLGGSHGYMSYVNRLAGYRAAMAERGIKPRPEWIVPNKRVSQEEGFQGMQRMLATLSPPSAAFVFNDYLAIGAVNALKKKQLRVPDDMALVSFDDIMPAAYTEPPLTTMVHPSYEKGALATRMLLSLVDGTELEDKQVLLKPRLKIRGSCGVNRRAQGAPIDSLL